VDGSTGFHGSLCVAGPYGAYGKQPSLDRSVLARDRSHGASPAAPAAGASASRRMRGARLLGHFFDLLGRSDPAAQSSNDEAKRLIIYPAHSGARPHRGEPHVVAGKALLGQMIASPIEVRVRNEPSPITRRTRSPLARNVDRPPALVGSAVQSQLLRPAWLFGSLRLRGLAPWTPGWHAN
jgi:hypothetical protein